MASYFRFIWMSLRVISFLVQLSSAHSPFVCICDELDCRIQAGRDCTEYDPWSGHLKASNLSWIAYTMHPMVFDDRRLIILRIGKSTINTSGSVNSFNWDLGDEQAICKMGTKNADVKAQAENRRYFQDHSESLLNKTEEFPAYIRNSRWNLG